MAAENEISDELVLSSKHSVIDLEALNASCRRQISLHLNLEGTFNEDIEMMNDFRGLAEMVGFGYLEIKNFELERSPTEQLLAEWTTRKDLSPTVGALWKNLLSLERLDVLADTKKLIERDCDKYLQIKARFKTSQQPIQDNTVSQTLDHKVDESVIMGIDDVKQGKPTIYDAFICYNPEGKDLAFVRQLIEILEVKNGLKLFIPWRDDLPGASHSTICAKVIENRCRRMIIILSPSYLESPSCEFQTKFAHALSPGARSKRLIPLLIEDCTMPEILRHITCCNYTKKDLLEWFWQRLVLALKSPLNPAECKSFKQSELISVNLDTSSSVSDWSSSGSSVSDSSSMYSSSSSSTYSSGSSSLASDSSAGSISNLNRSNDYLQPTSNYPTYLELLANSPPTHRKSNDYERISSVQRAKRENNTPNMAAIDDRESNYTKPIASQLYTRAQSPSNTAGRRSPAAQNATTNNVQQQQNISPLARNGQSSQGSSPAVYRRPVPPIPTQAPKKDTDQQEYFC